MRKSLLIKMTYGNYRQMSSLYYETHKIIMIVLLVVLLMPFGVLSENILSRNTISDEVTMEISQFFVIDQNR